MQAVRMRQQNDGSSRLLLNFIVYSEPVIIVLEYET